MIDSDLHDTAPRICIEKFTVVKHWARFSGEVGVVRHQPGFGVSGSMPEVAADLCGLSPEFVVLIRPARPEFVKVGNVVRGVGELALAPGSGYKDDHFGFGVKHVRYKTTLLRFVKHRVENSIGFGLIIKNTFAIAPARGGEKQRHDKPFFTVGSRVGVNL